MNEEAHPATDTVWIELTVCRNLDNRVRDLPDDSPYAVELHNRRRDALHEALSGWTVDDWGNTDTPEAHEEVTLLINAVPHVLHVVSPAAAWIGTELAKAGIAAFAAETVKALLAPLISKIKNGSIQNARAALRTYVSVDANFDDPNAEVGASVSIPGYPLKSMPVTLLTGRRASAPQVKKRPAKQKRNG
jgi:hypothetical protein